MTKQVELNILRPTGTDGAFAQMISFDQVKDFAKEKNEIQARKDELGASIDKLQKAQSHVRYECIELINKIGGVNGSMMPHNAKAVREIERYEIMSKNIDNEIKDAMTEYHMLQIKLRKMSGRCL